MPRTGFTRRARGQSLVEVLVAALVMAVLGFSVYDAMFATVRGVQVDRVNELRRQLTEVKWDIVLTPRRGVPEFQ